jgi:hypothetical protein
MAVTGVIDAVAVEVYHVVDAAGEEAATWLRFAGSTSRIGFGVLLVGLTAMSLFTVCIWVKGILRKFTWVWPSPFAQAERAGVENDASHEYALATWERGRPARQAFAAKFGAASNWRGAGRR